MKETLLGGVRVLDFGRYMAAPYCATLLGYLGAEVIRVEKRAGSEDRFISPLFFHADGSPGEGGLFMQTGCDKRSLAMDLGKPAARPVIDALIARADVVITNAPAPALARMGLDHARLETIRGDIISLNVSAFSSRGPDARRGGFDGVGQAMSGAAYFSGTPGRPAKAAAPYVDFSTAILGAFGVLAALMHRERTGEGQAVEAALLSTAITGFSAYLAEQAVLGLDREPTGNRVQTSAPSDVFATKDGHILTHIVGEGLFRAWAKLMGDPDTLGWLEDPAFRGDQNRGDRRDLICARMARWCAERTTEEALAELEAAGIPCGPVLTQREALENPQVAAMEIFKHMPIPGRGETAPVARLPVRFSRLETGPRRPPPAVGADTEAILAELGYDQAAIEALRAQAVI